jgi:hypothetical protein
MRRVDNLTDPVMGIYLAEVLSTIDTSRTGRIQVFVAAMAKEKQGASGYFDAIWTSPFAGSTDQKEVGKDITDPEQTISTYGFWAVPPDIGNFVLIAFGDGNTKYPLVISCLFPDKFNYMVPGNPGGKTYQAPGKRLPTMEKNKRTEEFNHNDTFRPVQHTLAKGIVEQGLINDPIRGFSTSGARRESPSEVFGLLTPGPRDPKNYDYRLGGHSITLDDHLNSRNIRIRTAQGQQMLLDDTTGIIYFINKQGKVWMEFNQAGDMTLFTEGDINMRAKGNFNLRADKNVNIEAGQNVNIKAAGDNTNGMYMGKQSPGRYPSGTGGHVHIESAADMKLYSSMDYYITSAGANGFLRTSKNLDLYAGTSLNLKAGVDMNMESTGSGDINIRTRGNILETAGKNKVEKATLILMNSGGPDAKPAATAKQTTQISTTTQQDQRPNRPGYTVTKGNVLPTNGRRTGPSAAVSTIVNPMATAEPYAGHGVPRPAEENEVVPDETVSDSLPANSTGLPNSDGQLEPAGSNSPEGYRPGLGYTADGTPQYGPVSGLTSNFSTAASKDFANSNAFSNLITALTSSIPKVEMTSTNPFGAAMVGILGKLSEYNASISTVGLDINGAIGDLQQGELSRFMGRINDIRRRFTSFDEVIEAAKRSGIIAFTDGLSDIFVDSQGRRIIDFSKGLGSISNQLLARANLGTTANIISRFIGVPISDNQLAALVSLANHIGTDKFTQSRALTALNNGDYAAVPNLMLDYSSGSFGSSEQEQFDQALLQRRQFEAELFSTPDSVPFPEYEADRVTFEQQARDIRETRKEECVKSR